MAIFRDVLPTDFTGDPKDRPEDIAYVREGAKENQQLRARRVLKAAYVEHQGREMTDADFDGWWSGAYGWGPPGIEGLDDWVRGIKHEGDRLKAVAAQKQNGTTPGVPPRTGQAPPGWDQSKWADPEHGTAKYDAAAFLYGLTKPSDIAARVQSDAFQERFPGATFNDKDKIDFGNVTEGGNRVGVIDVLRGADQSRNTSGGLYWNPSGVDSTGRDYTERDDTERDGTERDGTERDGTERDDKTLPWTPPLGSPLFNPPLTQGPPSMGYGMGPGGGGGGTMGQMITPYNPLATYSPVPYTTPDPFRPPAYEAGPTAADMTADPGYQFRLRQGQEALERSGAARGVTNTGGTLRDILDYGQQAASQEYGNVFGRQRDVYDLNERNRFNAYQANYGNAMDAYAMNERNRAGAFATNVGTARDAYAMNVANRFQGYQTNELARWQENQEAEARRSGAYGANLGAYERQQQYGLRAQGQGFDQSFRNWQEQYNQGRLSATDTYNRMYGLATT